MKLGRWGSACLVVLLGCAEVSADPAPTPTSNETPVTVAAPEPEPTIVVVELVTEPAVIFCPDGTEHVPQVSQITHLSDGSTQTEVTSPRQCKPWPTRCADGSWFIPPTALAGFASQCLAYGRPLFEWWVLLVFGSEAPTARRVIDCESGWSATALGPPVRTKRGTFRAKGLMQLFGKEGMGDVWEPQSNIRIGKRVRDGEGWDAWSCF